MKDDSISRQAAIDVIKAGRLTKLIDAETAINGLRALPPAQLKPRMGKWILGFDNRYMEKYYYCSCCGGRKYEESKPLDCYCSNCGADMRTKEMDCDYERAVE